MSLINELNNLPLIFKIALLYTGMIAIVFTLVSLLVIKYKNIDFIIKRQGISELTSLLLILFPIINLFFIIELWRFCRNDRAY
jgi:membrane protein YdbS with pleckstrin-like domain